MKVYFYMDRNPYNRSGVSWKMWKIERSGHEVTTWCGPATVVGRRPTPVGKLQSKTWRYRTEDRAKEAELQRVQEKLRKGYNRMAKRRSA